MKVFLVCAAFAASLLCAPAAAAQSASATWPLASSSAGTATGFVAAASQIISGGAPPMTVFDYSPNGQRLYMSSPGWTASAPPSDRFAQFDVAVMPGHTFTVGSVSFNYGASVRPSSMEGEVWYSTDAWVNRTQLTGSPVAYPSASMSAFLASPNVAVPSGGVFSVRIYPYAVLNQVVSSPQFAVHNTVTISGTTTPVASCTACLAPPPGLMGWWSGDSHAQDLAPSANHGTLQGSATYAPGKVGSAFSFASTSDYVSVPDHAALNVGTGDFSIDAWIRTTANHTVIVSKTSGGTSPTPTGYYLRVSGSVISWGWGDGTQHYAGAAATNVTLNDGQWHFVAATIQRGSSSTILLYADGQHVGTGTTTSINPTGSLTNTDPLLIGRTGVIPGLGFIGEIDELELFHRVLTPTEIADLYNAGANGKCKPAPTAREEEPEARGATMLGDARPNPFSNIAYVRYALPRAMPVRLDVFDMLGRNVMTLVDEPQGAGTHEAVLDGSLLPPGMYVYRLVAEGRTESRSIVLLR